MHADKVYDKFSFDTKDHFDEWTAIRLKKLQNKLDLVKKVSIFCFLFLFIRV